MNRRELLSKLAAISGVGAFVRDAVEVPADAKVLIISLSDEFEGMSLSDVMIDAESVRREIRKCLPPEMRHIPVLLLQGLKAQVIR